MCYEKEDAQASIITALTDMFDIIYEEPDENWLFRALSRGWFGSPDYYSEVREIFIDYILHNSRRFVKPFTRGIRWIYPKNDRGWRVGGEPEIVAFSEVYRVNIIVCDALSCSTPYLIAENENSTYTIYLLIINNNNFN